MNPVDNSDPSTHVYEDRILAFLDILGFTNLIEESKKDESKAAHILVVGQFECPQWVDSGPSFGVAFDLL